MVYVEFGYCAFGRLNACLLPMTVSAGGPRYLRIVLRRDSARLSHDRLVSVLAHELQHAIEVTAAPGVTTIAALDAMFARARPMVCVNCGAIPAQLVESTLFGHERGAFTGAEPAAAGIFEAADGGTVLLDEVGELPLAAQAALLRVLETRRVARVVGSEIEVDVRVVAATHRDLEAMCASGAFRLDLLYRLNAMTLTLPPLRARPEEIAPLALRFLQQANKANGRVLRGIEPGALALLQRYPWPGNARELRNAIERAAVIAEGDADRRAGPARARVERGRGRARGASAAEATAMGAGGGADDLRARLLRYEAELIVAALRAAGWNQTAAAQALGMPLRTLVHKNQDPRDRKLGFAPGGTRRGAPLLSVLTASGRREREIEDERGAPAWLALHADRASMGARNSARDEQPEAQAAEVLHGDGALEAGEESLPGPLYGCPCRGTRTTS